VIRVRLTLDVDVAARNAVKAVELATAIAARCGFCGGRLVHAVAVDDDGNAATLGGGGSGGA